MGFNFGKNSEKQVNTCHEDLQKILRLAIKRSKVDFGVSEGHRPVEKQQRYYSIGRTTELHRHPITNVDGINKKGKHNYKPSLASDLFIWHNDKTTRAKIAWDKSHLSYVAGIIDSCAEELYEKGEISHKIRWGANWDSDGVIDYDQSFDDFPHFELIKL